MMLLCESVIWTPVTRHVERCVEYVPVRRNVEVEVTPAAIEVALRLGATIDKRFEEARATK